MRGDLRMQNLSGGRELGAQTSFGDLVSVRPAWATGNPTPQKRKKKKEAQIC